MYIYIYMSDGYSEVNVCIYICVYVCICIYIYRSDGYSEVGEAIGADHQIRQDETEGH